MSLQKLQTRLLAMTDFKPVELSTLENRLGNALGLALGMIRDPSMIDNRAMAQIEIPFKEWCDLVISGKGK
jgi:hypothetical protein